MRWQAIAKVLGIDEKSVCLEAVLDEHGRPHHDIPMPPGVKHVVPRQLPSARTCSLAVSRRLVDNCSRVFTQAHELAPAHTQVAPAHQHASERTEAWNLTRALAAFFLFPFTRAIAPLAAAALRALQQRRHARPPVSLELSCNEIMAAIAITRPSLVKLAGYLSSSNCHLLALDPDA